MHRDARMPVQDRGYVRLVERGGSTFLLHDGTGEMRLLENCDGGKWSLDFSSSGAGLLTHSTYGDVLVSQVLAAKLSYAHREDGASAELCISDHSGAQRWHSDFTGNYTTLCFQGIQRLLVRGRGRLFPQTVRA